MKEVILVHDGMESAWVRQAALENAGYRVIATPSSEECLRMLGTHVPCLVITDVLVHGPHGFELCRRLRVQYDADTLPVLICSEIYRTEVFQEEARRVGAQGLLIKPVAPEDLLATVAELVDSEADQAA